MKTLYIVRHAKSSWDQPELHDHDRPLNSRGKKNAPEMGKRLKNKEVNPDVVISSTANRAISTAKKICTEIGYPKDKIITSEELYHADVADLMDIIRMQNDATKSLMIFGHNPGFTDLVNYLTEADIANVPTSGVVAIRFSVELWYHVDQGTGIILFFDYPKKTEEED